eukprot:gene13613-18268_t
MVPMHLYPKRFVATLSKIRLESKKHLKFSVQPLTIAWNSSLSPVASYQHQNILKKVRDTNNALNVPLSEVGPQSVQKGVAGKANIGLNLYGPREQEWWTGKIPKFGVCPGVEPNGNIYSLPLVTFGKGQCTRESIQAYFDNTWTLYEVLMSSLQGEDAFMRSPYHDLRHPLIFYYGHPAALYVNKLQVAGLLKSPINPYFESIFETGVDEMSWDDLSKNKMPWPSVSEVHSYRKQVYQVISNLISNLNDDQISNINQQSPLWSLFMGFEHDRIHLETSSFLIAELPSNYVRFPDGFPSYHPSLMNKSESEITRSPIMGKHYPLNEFIAVPKSSVEIGKSRSTPSFGWDNEYGYRKYDIDSFSASKYKITNGEFHAFVCDGGYGRNELWTEIGWKWRAFRNVKWPTMWIRKGPQGLNDFDLRVMFDVVPMPWDHPVIVNYHEAAAFAKWKSLQSNETFRIMTELEHRAIRDNCDKNEDYITKVGGNKMAEERGYNTNLNYSSTSPVNALKANSKGFHDVFGNAWEWTMDYFSPLPGFEVHPYYEDFSTPCFDGLHQVIQGGSFISTGSESSSHSRFHFRPHFYQHASFRLVKESPSACLMTSDTDAPGPYVGSYPFRQTSSGMLASLNKENDKLSHLNSMLSKHYGNVVSSSLLNLSNMHPTPISPLSSAILKYAGQLQINATTANAVEVGCGPGGISFALAKHFKSVIGIDHNNDLIEIARQLSQNKPVQFDLFGEGEVVHSQLVNPMSASSSSFLLSDEMADINNKLSFRCADPMCLPAEMIGFDVVIINDVIDKVTTPNAVFGRLGGVRGLVQKNGLLMVISGYKWNGATTPKSLWLGGTKIENGVAIKKSSEDDLIERLSADFTVIDRTKLPLYWYESSNEIKGQIQTLTVFQRK